MVESTSDMKKIANLFQNMMKSVEEISPTDKKFEYDMQDFDLKIQWDICGVPGYQIFNNGDYSWGFEEKLEDPDLILEITETAVALKFLRGEIEHFVFYYFKDRFVLHYIERWKSVKIDNKILKQKELKLLLSCYYSKGYHKKYHPFILTKIPIFRDMAEKWYNPETADVYYVPINESLGKFEDQILPVKVLEHFINKSEHFLLFNSCGCRVVHKCQDHDRSIGCMYLGADVVGLDDLYPKNENGHLGTREEALERVQLAYENGLVAVIGRLKMESEGLGIPDRGHFMTVCFCCPCCCVNGKFKYGTYEMGHLIKRIDGISVEVDRESCTGCEECMEVCAFDGMQMIDAKAQVNQEKCLGCGRCERICPSAAISITLDDPKKISDLFRKIEGSVDVT